MPVGRTSDVGTARAQQAEEATVTKTELIKNLQEREQRATEADDRWTHQRYAGQAEAYRTVISLLKWLDIPELRWKTGPHPVNEQILYEGHFAGQYFVGDYETVQNHITGKWIHLSDLLRLILPPVPPEEPDGFTIPGWDLE
jgi:hypothetical protein